MAENPRIEELRRRVQADPASIAFAALAEEFRRVGRYDDAIETCRTGLQRHPAYLSARVTLGRALIETGDFDGAREELETVLRSAPENLTAIRGLAQIHERLGHSSEMDPHLADMMKTMHAESIRVAAQPPPEPPVPVEDRGPRIEDRSAAPETILDPRSSILDQPQFEPEPQIEPEPQLEAQPEPAALPDLAAQPEVAAGPVFAAEPELAAEPAFAAEPGFAAEPELDPEPAFDLSLAPPLDLAPAADPDLALVTMTMDPEPEVEVETPAGPDPEMLATLAALARLERFLGAIQSLRG